MKLTAAQERRFWSRVELDDDGCWIWSPANVDTYAGYDYGTFYLKNKAYKAHRVAYEMLVGPIPPGLVLDHLCGNGMCVNVKHLEPVTQQENLRRAAEKRWGPTYVRRPETIARNKRKAVLVAQASK